MNKLKASWKRQGEENPKRNTIVVAGGKTNNWADFDSVEMFDWSTKSWSSLPSMKGGRFDPSLFAYDNQIIVAGGADGYTTFDTMEALPTESILETSARWSDFAAKLPKRLCGHRSVVYNDRMIVSGGYFTQDPRQVRVTERPNDGIYEVLLNRPYEQNLLMNMPEQRSCHGVELLKEKMCIFGGVTFNDEPSGDATLSQRRTNVLSFIQRLFKVETPSRFDMHILDTVLVYSFKEGTLRQLPPLPFRLCDMATVKWGDNVILIGGSGKGCPALNTVMMYDVTSGKSRMLPEMKYRRSGCVAVVTGNSIVVMAGENEESRYLKSVECFSFDRYLWEELPPMRVERYTSAAIAW